MIREQDPLKQGLKLSCDSRCCNIKPIIREQDPLKQGLKLSKVCWIGCCISIREQDPLKQGLKLHDLSVDIPRNRIFVSKIH